MPRTAKKWKYDNVAQLLEALGDIPPERVCMNPPPGTATKRDLIRKGGKRYELVERTLVEKPMGFPESYVGLELAWYLRTYLATNDLGYLGGADALLQIFPNLVRLPDVCFVSWDKTDDGKVSLKPIHEHIPDLIVEVLSPKNTRKEIVRKLDEYFRAGVRQVWIVNPRKRNATIYRSMDETKLIPETGTLDGEEVLPGFQVPLQKLFSRLERPKG